jgi:hypothetical protein
MEKKDFFIGIFMGLLVSFIGCFLFLEFFTNVGFVKAFQYMKMDGNLGKVITLGALLNVGVVFLLFKKDKDMMAKGVIFSIFILTIYTLFV